MKPRAVVLAVLFAVIVCAPACGGLFTEDRPSVNRSEGDTAGSAGSRGSGGSSATAAAAATNGSGAATATGGRAGGSGTGGRDATGGSATGGSATGGSSSGAAAGATGSSGTTGTGASAAATGSGGGEGIAGSGASGSGATGGSVPEIEPCEGIPIDPPDPEQFCSDFHYSAQPVPVDMLILLDRGLGMFELLWESEHTPWETVSLALEQLAQAPEAASVGVGLELFSSGGSLDHPVECDPASYTDPPIKIEPISQTIGAITEMLATTSGGGLAPTYAALAGALQYAVGHTATVTGRATAVVLVTDGPPSQCDEQSVEAIAELAHEAYPEHRVLTFAIGLTSHVENLEPIAEAGGTRAAILIEGGNTTEQLLDALLGIATTPLSCESSIRLPPDSAGPVDYDKVRLFYTPPGGDTREIPRLSMPSLCADSPYGGWFYDSVPDPNSIRVCACTCDYLAAGMIEVYFGCVEPMYLGN